MAKFYKATNWKHPKHELPSVLWDPTTDKAVFEFLLGESGHLECNTDDPAVIKVLQDMGYDQEPDPELNTTPPSVKAAATQRKSTPPVK